MRETWWRGDYADLREHIRRHGRLDVVESLVVSSHDKAWDGWATNDRTHIDPWTRNHWPTRPTLKQARALRRDARRRRSLLAQQDVVVQGRRDIEVRAAREREARREHVLAIQAREEALRAERERKRAARANAAISPHLLYLLRIPAERRSPDAKVALAHALEHELMSRGARPFAPLDQETATWFAALDPRAAQLVKHDWLMANLDTLWRQYPPAPAL